MPFLIRHPQSTSLDPFSRRDLLKLSAAGFLGGAAAPWFTTLAAHAADSKATVEPAKRKTCIMLWLAGGPSQLDTFDMKPGTRNAGEFKPISTNVAGIQICELMPKLAKQADKLALLRSMSTGEADHFRGSYFMQTGYRSIAGTSHPHLGSIAAAELGQPDFELPNFFWMGTPSAAGVGFLGAKHAPFKINNVRDEAAQNIEDVRPSHGFPAFDRKAGILDQLEARFLEQYHGAKTLADHRATYHQAARMMRSNKLSALDLNKEPKIVRETYGNTPFGKSCLLARRLVEVGVPFVGVSLGDFDTHNDNWGRLKPLLPLVDHCMAALLQDLEVRGLLDSTLVICMGEFGRDPKINGTGPKAGREHYARAWTTVLAGGGIKTGQVIGKTSKGGEEVTERPISAKDFMATLCRILGIDDTKKNITPAGRPIRIVDAGAKPVAELF
ncbi:MAG TPA: DUF1501 domain-containing protein [Gemmataceae bacterium]|nr:DUF1501 domain-containing protein [Gemmataceae bacterium]